MKDLLTPSLRVGRAEILNFFELIGEDEDSISLAIAWSLKCCPHFLKKALHSFVGKERSPDRITIAVHRHEAGGGITDIEIESPGTFHAIVEAKKGWVLPEIAQLERYAQRLSFSESAAGIKRLITLSECSELYASQRYAGQVVAGHEIHHVSWQSIVRMCADAMPLSSYSEKRILRDLIAYLEKAMTVQQQDSNLVYVVSLGPGTPKGWQISLIDVVAKYNRYFHPISGTWPKTPPNYMAFRHGGQLQSIHHVEQYEVIHDLKVACPGIPKEPCEPHFLYRLGQAIKPNRVVKNGSVWPSGRVWCALDTLLTSESISQARDLTAKRRGNVGT